MSTDLPMSDARADAGGAGDRHGRKDVSTGLPRLGGCDASWAPSHFLAVKEADCGDLAIHRRGRLVDCFVDDLSVPPSRSARSPRWPAEVPC